MSLGGRIVLSCEHADRRVPRRYRPLFLGRAKLLESHRAYDLGILPLAQQCARLFDCPLSVSPITRLLIDVNRSLGHRHLFSEFTRSLSPADRQYLVEQYYRPYREQVIRHVEACLRRCGRVLHLSLHSFTPVLKGRVRGADIGILYDPSRPNEREIARRLRLSLLGRLGLRVRRNYPYLGISDGLTTALRRRYDADRYVGLEIEFNQRLLPSASSHAVARLAAGLYDAVVQIAV